MFYILGFKKEERCFSSQILIKMSVRKEVYVVFGLKLSEQTTEDYWEKDFRDETEWDKNKPKDKPFFITDGMNELYTFLDLFKN